MNMKNLIKYGFIALVICFFTACTEPQGIVFDKYIYTKTVKDVSFIDSKTGVIKKKDIPSDTTYYVEIEDYETMFIGRHKVTKKFYDLVEVGKYVVLEPNR